MSREELIAFSHPVSVGAGSLIIRAMATLWTDAPPRAVLTGQVVVNSVIGFLLAARLASRSGSGRRA